MVTRIAGQGKVYGATKRWVVMVITKLIALFDESIYLRY